MAQLNSTGSEHIAMLDEEIRLLGQLKVTLDAERDAIVSRDIEALRRNGELKLSAIETLASLELQRKPLHAIRAQSETEQELTMLGELKRLTRLCNEQNSANDALLRAERRFVDSLLNLLRGGGRTPADVYGADAALSTPGTKRLPLASA